MHGIFKCNLAGVLKKTVTKFFKNASFDKFCNFFKFLYFEFHSFFNESISSNKYLLSSKFVDKYNALFILQEISPSIIKINFNFSFLFIPIFIGIYKPSSISYFLSSSGNS